MTETTLEGELMTLGFVLLIFVAAVVMVEAPVIGPVIRKWIEKALR
jgi:hypothetical protein